MRTNQNSVCPSKFLTFIFFFFQKKTPGAKLEKDRKNQSHPLALLFSLEPTAVAAARDATVHATSLLPYTHLYPVVVIAL